MSWDAMVDDMKNTPFPAGTAYGIDGGDHVEGGVKTAEIDGGYLFVISLPRVFAVGSSIWRLDVLRRKVAGFCKALHPKSFHAN